MSEPEVEWFVEQIQKTLAEIDRLVLNSPELPNSYKEIITYDTNEVMIKLHTIIRKLKK